MNVGLLFVWLEDYLKICDDNASLERGHIAQIVLAHHIVDDAVLLLADLNLVLPQTLNVLFWHYLAELFDARTDARLLHHDFWIIFVDLSGRLLRRGLCGATASHHCRPTSERIIHVSSRQLGLHHGPCRRGSHHHHPGG